MTTESLLFGATLLFYFIAAVSYHAHLFTGSERARQAALVCVPLGLAVHTAALGSWCLTHRGYSILRDPDMPYSLVAYFIAAVQVVANLRPKWASLGALTMPVAFICEFYSGSAAPGTAFHQAQPVAGALLRPHVMVLLLGFAAFALAFCLAVLYLIQSRLLQAKQVRGLAGRLPPLESVATAAHWLAAIGFSMLTLGIVTGAIAAPQAWGDRWYLDPRTLTSVIAWAIYAAYLGAILFLGWRGRRTTYFLIAGFLVVAIAFFASVSRPAAARRETVRPSPRQERRAAALPVSTFDLRPW
jgi:ABC-type uncharacterized transport system permease subunit